MIESLFTRYRDTLNQFFASCSDEELRQIQAVGISQFQGSLIAEDLARMIAYRAKGSKSLNKEFNKIFAGFYRK